MKKYIIVAGLSMFFSAYADDNPFSLGVHLQKIDNEKIAFLDTLEGTGNSSSKIFSSLKRVKKAPSVVHERDKTVASAVNKISHIKQNYLEAQKRIKKAKKIRQQRVKALERKEYLEVLRRREKEKKLQKKRVENKKTQNLKPTRQQTHADSIKVKVAKQIQTNVVESYDTALSNIEKEYLDAIKAVDK